jgi:hypothetical protein
MFFSAYSIRSADETGGGGGEASTNYRGPVVRKGAQVPTVLRMFLSFLVVSLFIDCTN